MDQKLVKYFEENVQLKKEIDVLREENRVIHRRLYFLEIKEKEKNLIIYGLPEVNKDNSPETVHEFCEKALGIKYLQVPDACIPRWNKEKDKSQIIVKFNTPRDINSIFINSFKLRNTGIWINRDLTYTERKLRKKLLEIKSLIKEKDKTES